MLSKIEAYLKTLIQGNQKWKGDGRWTFKIKEMLKERVTKILDAEFDADSTRDA